VIGTRLPDIGFAFVVAPPLTSCALDVVAITLTAPATAAATSLLRAFMRTPSLSFEPRRARPCFRVIVPLSGVENHNSMVRRTLPVIALGWFVYCVATVALAQTAADPGNLSANARFLVAARNADAAAMKRELAAGAAIDSRNRLGESALIIVLKKDRADLAALLLDAGANVNQAALNGITPLMAAAYGGHEAIVKRLLAQGADPHPVDRLNKTAMVYAAGEGRTGIVQMLVVAGIAPDEVYANDLTALMWAAGYGKTATVQALLDAGADRTRRDNRGKTAADIAREQGFSETAALLQPR
jgi:hypothetical protein